MDEPAPTTAVDEVLEEKHFGRRQATGLVFGVLGVALIVGVAPNISGATRAFAFEPPPDAPRVQLPPPHHGGDLRPQLPGGSRSLVSPCPTRPVRGPGPDPRRRRDGPADPRDRPRPVPGTDHQRHQPLRRIARPGHTHRSRGDDGPLVRAIRHHQHRHRGHDARLRRRRLHGLRRCLAKPRARAGCGSRFSSP